MPRWSALVFLAVLVSLAACSSSGPSVSGFGMGSTRRVSVGDDVVIRLPASAETGAAKWTLDQFDSWMLSLTQRPRIEQANERLFWTCRFVARNPGDTEVVLRRTAAAPDAPGDVGERRRFTVRIR